MPRQCVVCQKGTETGNTVSHSQRKVRRTWMPNLQKVRIIKGSSAQRAYVCTKCLKANKVQRAL